MIMSEGNSYQQLSVNGSLVATSDMHLVQYLIMKHNHHWCVSFFMNHGVSGSEQD